MFGRYVFHISDRTIAPVLEFIVVFLSSSKSVFPLSIFQDVTPKSTDKLLRRFISTHLTKSQCIKH